MGRILSFTFSPYPLSDNGKEDISDYDGYDVYTLYGCTIPSSVRGFCYFTLNDMTTAFARIICKDEASRLNDEDYDMYLIMSYIIKHLIDEIYSLERDAKYFYYQCD